MWSQLHKSVDYLGLRSGSEVDLVLSNKKELIASEIKLTKGKISSAFQNRYPNAKTHVITTKNFF